MQKSHKGTIVIDEGAKREYVKIAQEEGSKIILIPPSQRNIGLSDRAVVQRYTKNIHPIFTNDKTSYKESGLLTLGRNGYVVHEFVRREEEDAYREKIKLFFKMYTEKHTHGVV
ncbi:MAG: hypothetical protein AAB553_03790 [Patescibacteria group bacterium]